MLHLGVMSIWMPDVIYLVPRPYDKKSKMPKTRSRRDGLSFISDIRENQPLESVMLLIHVFHGIENIYPGDQAYQSATLV
jgi:hypothetical protein